MAKEIQRLKKEGANSPLAELARVLVRSWLNRPLDREAVARTVISGVRASFQRWDRQRMVESLEARLSAVLEATDGTILKQLAQALDALGELPPLHEDILWRLTDLPALRALGREILQETLMEFVRTAGSPLTENRIASGVFAKAKGFAERAGAKGILGVVTDTLSQEAEKRVNDFVEQGVSKSFSLLIQKVTDPKRGGQINEIKKELLLAGSTIPPSVLASQLEALDLPSRAGAVMEKLKQWVSTAEFEVYLRSQLDLHAEDWTGSVQALFEQFGFEVPLDWLEKTVELELRVLVSTPEVEKWLQTHFV